MLGSGDGEGVTLGVMLPLGVTVAVVEGEREAEGVTEPLRVTEGVTVALAVAVTVAVAEGVTLRLPVTEGVTLRLPELLPVLVGVREGEDVRLLVTLLVGVTLNWACARCTPAHSASSAASAQRRLPGGRGGCRTMRAAVKKGAVRSSSHTPPPFLPFLSIRLN